MCSCYSCRDQRKDCRLCSFLATAWEADVHNLAVHSEFRRQGIGRLLLQQVVIEARRQFLTRVMLEVRQSNIAAQKLYQSMGFVTSGIRKGYYSDDGEDAVAMTLELNPE